MPPTAHFNELKQRVDELGSHMLPVIKPGLTYTPAEHDCVRAYVLLVHAEVETFLEQRVKGEVACRIAAWDAAGTPSVVLMGLLAFHDGVWVDAIESLTSPVEGDKKNPTWSSRDVDTRLRKCQTQTVYALNNNNGIKAKDVLDMLLRLGFRVGDIDSDLISQLDALGTDRGNFAHNAVRAVTNQPDPALAKAQVTEIVDKLQELDVRISALV